MMESCVRAKGSIKSGSRLSAGRAFAAAMRAACRAWIYRAVRWVTGGFYKRLPIGPVSLISPFNFPLIPAAHKIAPAIAAGSPWRSSPRCWSRSPRNARWSKRKLSARSLSCQRTAISTRRWIRSTAAASACRPAFSPGIFRKPQA